MQHRPYPSRHFRAPLRVAATGLLVVAMGVVMAACGSSGPSSSSSTTRTTVSGSCTGVAGANHARVVVEVSAKDVVKRCVGFAGKQIPALKLLAKGHVELGTQQYSFGLAICQVDHVPSHYSQCLPSGADYWAVFLSTSGHRWTTPSTGVSGITVPAGGSLGLRYDSPKGTPAPPSPPTPA